MAFDSSSLEGYVDVPARLRMFYEKYPTGSVQAVRTDAPFEVLSVPGNGSEVKTYIVYSALAYRAPDDPCPGQGTAWEPFPGRTPYTKDSEVQNAETSAWGRAIAAVMPVEKIATREDVRNRREEQAAEVPKPARKVRGRAAIDKELAKMCEVVGKSPAEAVVKWEAANGKTWAEATPLQAEEWLDVLRPWTEKVAAEKAAEQNAAQWDMGYDAQRDPQSGVCDVCAAGSTTTHDKDAHEAREAEDAAQAAARDDATAQAMA